jgi:trans-aconitate methyltransferase
VTSPAEEIVSLYERHAAAWDRSRDSHRFIEAAWMKRFEALLPAGSTVLDIGCGSGRPIAQHLIENGFQIVGIDSSQTLISTCRARFPDHRWIVADMRTLSLDSTFQGLIAWNSFFHLSHEHQRAMFAIFAEHAAPGAALIFTTGTEHGEAIGSLEGERLYHASLSTEEYRKLLESHGFRIVRHEIEDPNCGGHTIWLARKDASTDSPRRKQR